MSKVVEAAVAALDEKAKGFDGTAKFVIEGEGSVYIDANGARAADDEAEVTLTASRETFEGIIAGDVNPTTAFMTGKLKVDGAMGTAMRLGALLS
ncbi:MULTISPECIES: SCP2 sterol-binding domain-containing protein [Paracoccus]|uniref:SCP2 sterol-binding domain-containing protein n=1 Tax=Paracoccus TaxID=265 RepID=UPI0007860799|nr:MULTISPECIES: SCP2 sterol-binding domain-containing protein [Paracoccus]MCV2446932.1 SCP2 sterol-binding domain-containing protein [Paracoccus sp. DMF]MDF3606638.1 SCP2 sterol-binding domain-containing protein [Paracoccus sp. DMF-8]